MKTSPKQARRTGCACGGNRHSAQASRSARRAARRVFEAAKLLLCRGETPEANNTASFRFLSRRVDVAAVVVLMTAPRHGATPGRLKQLRATVGVSRRTGGTMAGMVAGGIFAPFVLEMGERTNGRAGGRASAAVIVAGVISEAGGRRKDDRFAALHPAVNDGIGPARSLRVARGRGGCRLRRPAASDPFPSGDIPAGSLKDLSDHATFLRDH